MSERNREGPVFAVDEHTEIQAYWFVSMPADQQFDWAAMVFRDSSESPWRATYRFRYYAEASVGKHPSEWRDEFSVFEITPNEQEDEPGKLVEVIGSLAKLFVDGTVAVFMGPANGEEFTAWLTEQNFAHGYLVDAEGKPGPALGKSDGRRH